MVSMSIFSKFTYLIFLTTYLGIFFLRIFHFGFIYERPSAILLECIPTVSISFLLIVSCLIVERPILRKFEEIIKKGRKSRDSLTESDIAECMRCYKKFDIAIAAGDAVGFLLGAGSTSIIEAAKGIVPFEPAIFIIIELQSVGVGFLCYTINVFLIKRVLMAGCMKEIGMPVNENLSQNLNIAIVTSIYLSVMNMMTIPINLLKNGGEGAFQRFVVYFVIGASLNMLICFVTYSLIIRRIQEREKRVSRTLLEETKKLAESTKKSASTSCDQSAAVKEIVATMHDSTELANNIGNKVKHVTGLAEKSRDAVVVGSQALQKNMQELIEIKNTNLLTIEEIKELNKKINGVWDIVSIINNVADQTKIIAFNAELEASSSGEAGKNFHIVATEIRRLSDNIIDSIKEIREIINEIQHASDTLILDSEKSSSQIDAGCESASALESGFSSIMASSNATAESTREILDFVGQMTISSEQIFITLQQIAHGIEDFSVSTTNISTSSEAVKEIASQL